MGGGGGGGGGGRGGFTVDFNMLLESCSVLNLCFFVAKDPKDKPAI